MVDFWVWLMDGSWMVNFSRQKRTTHCLVKRDTQNTAETRFHIPGLWRNKMWVSLSFVYRANTKDSESKFLFTPILPVSVSICFCGLNLKNASKACNVLVEIGDGTHVLSNFGKRINCTLTVLFPSSFGIRSLQIGSPAKMTECQSKDVRCVYEKLVINW